MNVRVRFPTQNIWETHLNTTQHRIYLVSQVGKKFCKGSQRHRPNRGNTHIHVHTHECVSKLAHVIMCQFRKAEDRVKLASL